jgi:hypothetical protein
MKATGGRAMNPILRESDIQSLEKLSDKHES